MPTPRPSENPAPSAGLPAHANLSDDERLLMALLDVSPFPAAVSRLRDHTVVAVNSHAAEIFGIEPAEALGLRVTDYYVDPAERGNLAEQVRRDGRADGIRLHMIRKTGEPFWALASAKLVAWAGEPAVFTIFQNISQQIAAEETLRASEQRLAAQSRALTGLTARYADPGESFDDRLRGILAESALTLRVDRLSLWRFDREHHAIQCVSMFLRMAGRYESGARLHRPDAPAYFEALENERVIAAHDAPTDPRTAQFTRSYLDPNSIGAMLDVPLRQSNVAVGVLCAEHVGGPRVWTVDEQNFAVSTANLIVVAVANEERRAALARLAESEARARLVVDTAHDAFVGIDASGRIVNWNVQAERTFGWSREEAIGRNLADTIVPAQYRDAHTRGLRRFLETGLAPVINTRLELTALHRSGREFPIEITISEPMQLERGVFFGAFLRDITDRCERDEQLRQAKESAEAATRAKSEFLANMSHELRTPLNGVLGYAQLLQRDRRLHPAQREALDAIAKCGSHLLDLINDILDLSKIEAGRLDIEAATTDLAQLTIDLRYVIAESARRKGLLLSLALAPDVPRHVVLDGRHLRQVLLNLLGNAIKFTPQGEVRLVIARTPNHRLSFEVIDTGVGIEAEALPEIFGAFTQTGSGAAAGGTGLGLTISRHLVQAMGDDLHVESVVGQGSRFFFTLPLVPAPERLRRGQADPEPVGPPLDARLADDEELTALVADDSTVSRRILASLLESAGVRVITAAGGLEALQLAREHPPDVIFMDLRMNDLDGLEATRRLLADPLTAAIPVIAVTASAFGDVRDAAREAGCTDYLPKPVRAESLFAVLQKHLGVHFVTGRAPEVVTATVAATATTRRPDVVHRLREAVAIGSVTDLESLAQELAASDAADATLGQRIAQLVTALDVDGLRDLVQMLSDTEARRNAGC